MEYRQARECIGSYTSRKQDKCSGFLTAILEPILFSGGHSGNLDNCCAESIVTGLRRDVGTGAGMVSCVFLVWGERTGISWNRGRRPSSGVADPDWDEFPNPTCLESTIIHDLDLVWRDISYGTPVSVEGLELLPLFRHCKIPNLLDPRPFWSTPR